MESRADAAGPTPRANGGRQGLRRKAVAIWYLWWAGFRSALQLHKCVIFFVHDPGIWVKTAQCFILNGVIYLGSISLFRYGLAPGGRWLLEAGLRRWPGPGPAPLAPLLAAFELLFNALWLFPAYLISQLVNCLWYNEIAERAFAVIQARNGGSSSVPPAQQQRAAASLSLLVGQELYRAALFSVYLLQMAVVGYVPYVGRVLEFILLAWLYAFYCFDYKWALLKQPLAARIAFFESQWAFLSGFGAVCTLTTVAAPFYVGAAVMAALFPLFILLACDTSPRDHMQRVTVLSGSPPLEFGSLPIFGVSTLLMGLLIRNFNSIVGFLCIPRRRRAP